MVQPSWRHGERLPKVASAACPQGDLWGKPGCMRERPESHFYVSRQRAGVKMKWIG